ncbi:MAG: energy-coupling factor transporter ATPase [Nitrososphaerales archaeon]
MRLKNDDYYDDETLPPFYLLVESIFYGMSMDNKEIVVSLKNISFWYPDGTNALKNIDLKVRRGDILAIIGKNGAGKTTLCLTIVGIIPNIFPGRLEGEIDVLGKKPSQLYVYEVTKDVGIVLQDPDSQLFSHSVFSEITFAAENLALHRDEIIKRAKWALEVVGLEGFEDRMPKRLSGGQKQRVAIAAALVTRPQILVLDEPTSQLDPVGTREVLETLKKLNREENITIIMTEHKTDEVAEIASEIIILEDGRILQQGEPTKIFQDISTLVQLKLKPPEIAEFFWKLKKVGIELKSLPLKIDDGLSLITGLLEEMKLKVKTDSKEIEQPKINRENILLEVKNVSFEYPSQPPVKALEKINLAVREGEFVAIVGKNGSGKTTLLKCMVGLLKPTEGEITFKGMNVKDLPARERVRIVSLVLQNPDQQLFLQSVSEEIRFGLRNIGCSKDEMERIITDVLKRVGLDGYREMHPFQLSFGDRKKLAVASVLALNPEIIILDEPTTGQDYKGRIEICDLALELNKKGKTIIMVTHDMDLVAKYAERMIVMNDGKIIFDGTVREGFTKLELLKTAGLMPPRITVFAQLLKRYGIPSSVLSTDELLNCFIKGDE